MEQDWGNFAVITGSSAGALTGLLFVAVSLNRERIASHAALRAQGLTLTAIGRGKEPEGDDSEAALARLIDRASPNLLVLLFILVAGCLELAGVDGLYWVAASSAVSLVGGVINAWLFLVR